MAYLKPPAFTRQHEVVQAAEVPVDERKAIIARYREVAGSLVGPCFTRLPDARDHPVFHIVHLS
jgi:hypothetical protein